MIIHIVADVEKKSEFSGCSVVSGSKTFWTEFNRSPLSAQTSPDLPRPLSVDDGVGGDCDECGCAGCDVLIN